VNDANQAPIFFAIDERVGRPVAEGDLTQEATVTEDITGAYRGSVNYTVKSCACWWAALQNGLPGGQTTAEVDQTSTELLALRTSS